jgi:hypothetical protein
MVHRFRWMVIVEQELRVLVKTRPFLLLVLVAMLHIMVRLLQVVACDVIMQDPNNPLTPLLKTVQGIMVSERMFFDFLWLQGPVLFIVCLYAGSGMICNDVRNNLLEVYFSKPIRWYDYALGKIITLGLIGLCLTAVPGLLLVILHNLLIPGDNWQTLFATYWWPAAILGFSLILILPCVLVILACSALLPSQNFSAIAVVMVLMANSAMGGLLAVLLQERNYLLISFPMAMHRVGQHFFNDRRLIFDLRWEWAMLFVTVVCLWGAWVVFRRARRAEIAL